MRDKILYLFSAAAGLLFVRNLYGMLMNLPDEAAQGAIYRIMFFHIPSWFTCFALFFVAGVCGVVYLSKKSLQADCLAVASIEVGVAFTIVGLATGSIWARIIWGIWWTWDARLTWALITCLVYFGYLMLRKAIDDATTRARIAGVYGTFAFVSVVITFKAIEWWRTQHPAPVLDFRTGGGQIDKSMQSMIYWNWLALMLLAIVLVALRMRQETRLREVEGIRRFAHLQ